MSRRACLAELRSTRSAPEPILRLSASQALRQHAAVDARRPRRARGRVPHHRRAVGLAARPRCCACWPAWRRPATATSCCAAQRINDLPPNRRPTCLVFQSLALFPHQHGGREHRVPAQDEGRRGRGPRGAGAGTDAHGAAARELLTARTSRNARAASGSASRWPAPSPTTRRSCSSTSRCRRIDYKLKKVLEKELKDIHKETGKTFIYITHSLEEAMVMSDRIGVMRAGRLVQVGTPEEIYTRPADRFVSEFMGDVNVDHRSCPRPTAALEGVDVAGHFRVAGDGARARAIIVDPAGVPALRRDPGRGRQRRSPGTALQRVLAGLAHAVPGARRRQGLRASSVSRRAAWRRRLDRPRDCSAGTPPTRSSSAG